MTATTRSQCAGSMWETGHNPPGVALDSGLREMGNLRVGNDDRHGDRVGHCAQAGAKDNANARAERAQLASEELRCFRDLVEVGH